MAIFRWSLSGVRRGDDERNVTSGVDVGGGGAAGLADTIGVMGGVVLGDVSVEYDASSIITRCFMNATKVTTMRSMRFIPAGRISRNARRDRDTMPILARRKRASGIIMLSAV
jgi:hypothetical protein